MARSWPIAGVAVVLASTALLPVLRAGPEAARVEISRPVEGAVVPGKVTVEGSVENAEPGGLLRVNGADAKLRDGLFESVVTFVQDGPTRITVAYALPAKPAVKAERNVVVDRTPPRLEVAAPATEESFHAGEEALVQGVVHDPHLKDLRMNGQAVEVRSDGAFEATFLLPEKEAVRVVLEALDAAGNRTSLVRVLRRGKEPRPPPEPGDAAEGSAASDRLAEARGTAVKGLERVAAWCHESQVFLERDRVYEAILLLSPDHARARSVLKYVRRQKDGPWEQVGYWPPKNFNKALVPEASKRMHGALSPYRDAVLTAVSEAGPKITPARRTEELERLVDLLPDDDTLRRSRGDVQHEGRWMLPETVEGIARRNAMQGMLARARKAAPPIQPDPTAVQKRWRSGVIGGNFGCCGYVSESECIELVQLLETGHLFLSELLGATEVAPTPKRIVLFDSPKLAEQWLALQPDPEHAEAKRLFPHVTGLWLPSGTNMRYHPDPVVRRLGTLRQVLKRGVEAREPGERDRGWVSEGLGQRLTWHMAGRHGTAFVTTGQTENAHERTQEEVLPAPDREWLSAAARLLSFDPARRLEPVLTMRLNAMRADDVLVAYALSAYLLEGRHESLREFLRTSLAEDSADRQCLNVFSVDCATLSWRLRRWTMETSSL